MGSFNTTCFVSQQTIASDDDVYLFPIKQSASYHPVKFKSVNSKGEEVIVEQYSYAHSTCYPTALWTMAGPMFSGKYDDYGRFTLTDNESNKTNLYNFLKSLEENALETLVGENTSHDIAFNIRSVFDSKKSYSFNQLIEVFDYVWISLQEERVFAKDYSNIITPLAFSVMHKATGDYLVDKISEFKDYQDNECNQHTKMKNYLNKIFTRYKNYRLGTVSDDLFLATLKIASLEGFGIGDFEGSNVDMFYNKDYSKIEKIMIDYIKTDPNHTEIDDKTIQSIIDIMQDLLTHKYIVAGLKHLNVKFLPIMYAGQDYSNEMGIQFAEMVTSISKKVTAHRKSLYDDEEYDEEVETRSITKLKM